MDKQILGMGILAALFGVGSLAIAFFLIKRVARLEADGTQTHGEVVSRKAKSESARSGSGSGMRYYLRVKYPGPDGASHTVKLKTGPEVYEAHPEGSSIALVYLPEAPDEPELLVPGWNSRGVPIMVAVAGVVLMAFGGVVVFSQLT